MRAILLAHPQRIETLLGSPSPIISPSDADTWPQMIGQGRKAGTLEPDAQAYVSTDTDAQIESDWDPAGSNFATDLACHFI
jgi:hypothetical protein